MKGKGVVTKILQFWTFVVINLFGISFLRKHLTQLIF